MDERENEECFRMVRAHRDCYPKWERVVLASESKCREMIQAKKTVDRELVACLRRTEEAEARVRAWHVITVFAAAASAGIGVLIGLIM